MAVRGRRPTCRRCARETADVAALRYTRSGVSSGGAQVEEGRKVTRAQTRLKASRIAPGAIPKYRTELARPHCRIRLPACQVAGKSHWGKRHIRPGVQLRRPRSGGSYDFAVLPYSCRRVSDSPYSCAPSTSATRKTVGAAFPRSARSAQTHTRARALCLPLFLCLFLVVGV